MGELNENKFKERVEVNQSPIEKMANDKLSEVTEEELNEALNTEHKSLDCRSECKYNTGESYKYSNYGYSD